MPGTKYRSIKAPRVYEALRARGYPKGLAARIANASARRARLRGMRRRRRKLRRR